MIFIWYLVFSGELVLVHIIYGAIITMLIHILLADLSVLAFNIICTIMIFAELYIDKMLGLYIRSTKSGIF